MNEENQSFENLCTICKSDWKICTECNSKIDKCPICNNTNYKNKNKINIQDNYYLDKFYYFILDFILDFIISIVTYYIFFISYSYVRNLNV